MTAQSNPAFASLKIQDITISEDFPIDNGGDFILRSADETYFSVHRVILALASPVFNDMLSIGTQSEENPADAWTGVAEDTGTLNILLKCIYPSKAAPVLDDLSNIALAFRAAHKYQINKLSDMLGKEILASRPRGNLPTYEDNNNATIASHLTEHPVHCYALARLYDIPLITEAALKAAASLCFTNRVDEADAGCREVDEMPTAWFRDLKRQGRDAVQNYCNCV
ncbi:hypothetical protein HGRIS_012301 [Hohenbuehelia grisea]|uniref:BTB domain-containing protein n=1 Tax=Hohenbuehelia grisea TaxID=104357 RepID=A0ABR3IRX2_9AGAR